MSEITTNDVRIQMDGRTLTITSRDNPNMSLTLNTEAIDILADLVQSVHDRDVNRRKTFRVPLHNSGELRAVLHKGERSYHVTPTNISITGLFVIPKPGCEAPRLSQRDFVKVELEMDGERLVYDAVVVRQQGNGLGLFFPESMRGEQIHPPHELLELVMELHRRMMMRQARSSFGVTTTSGAFPVETY